MVGEWYESGSRAVREWYESGTRMVREWYGSGSRVVREWYGSAAGVVREWYGSGKGVARELYGSGMGMVWEWYESGGGRARQRRRFPRPVVGAPLSSPRARRQGNGKTSRTFDALQTKKKDFRRSALSPSSLRRRQRHAP